MPDHLLIAREILHGLLVGGARKGAPLKASLVREFELRTREDFNAVFRRFPKFLSFLAANADLVDIQYPTGSGDITVSLKQSAVAGQPRDSQTNTSSGAGAALRMPSPLWHAFTNPDANRRRFFHRLMHNVVHYVDGSTAEPNVRIAEAVRADRNYVEILPATADEQSEWMKDFVRTHEIPQSKRQLIDSLLEVPFTSQLNRTFCTALGELCEQWNNCRAGKVQEHVETWAAEQGVAVDDLSTTATGEVGGGGGSFSLARPAGINADSDLRRTLHLVVDGLENSELAHVLLPASAVLRLIAKRGVR